MNTFTFTLTEMAAAFDASENEIRNALYLAGFNPVDYGVDGMAPSYDVAALRFVAERFPRRASAPAAAAGEQHFPGGAICKMVVDHE